MKKNSYLIAGILLAANLSAHAKDYAIEHLEPASWWVGMQDSKLQLLVHGKDIGELSASLNYPGVTITDVVKVDNKNYLFINLNIAPETIPGNINLQFKRQDKTVLNFAYPIQARATHSAQRHGFSPSDAIYLIVPDRYANGDAKNDSIGHQRQSRQKKCLGAPRR